MREEGSREGARRKEGSKTTHGGSQISIVIWRLDSDTFGDYTDGPTLNTRVSHPRKDLRSSRGYQDSALELESTAKDAQVPAKDISNNVRGV